MGSRKAKISKSQIAVLTAGDKLWDTEVSGLYVFRQKTKTCFYFKYRVKGKQKLSNIGAYGSISIEDARDKARAYYALARDSIDPSAYLDKQAKDIARQNKKEGYTIGDAYADWEEHYKPLLKPSSLSEWTLYDRYVKPEFEDVPLIDIMPEWINRFHASIKKPYSANRAIKIMKKLFKIARQMEKYEGKDPFIALVMNPEKKRKRHLTGDEPKRLFKVLESYKHEGKEEFKASSCIMLYLLTSARKSEWLSAPKEWVDLDNATLSLPETKNSEADEKMLPSLAVEILRELFKRYPDSPWIFPSPRNIGEPLEGIKRHWKEIKKQAKIEDLRLHDLRRSFASFGLTQGYSLEQIGGLNIPSTLRLHTPLMMILRITSPWAKGPRIQFCFPTCKT